MNLMISNLQIAAFVECAVGERLQMGFQFLEDLKILILVLDDLRLEFWSAISTVDELNKVSFFGSGDERLFF